MSTTTAQALKLLDLADPLIAEALALLAPAELARARRLSKRCNEVHVPQAELVVRQRVEATVRARGWSTVAAGRYHTVHVRRSEGTTTVFSWGGNPYGQHCPELQFLS